jgi:hypothetical protein
MTKRGSIAAMLTLASAVALAQEAPQATTPEEADKATLTGAQTPDEIAAEAARAQMQRVAPEDPVVFNGGISLEERAGAPDEGTKLEFFLGSGAYLSDVQVTVADAEGNELVNTVTDGPWLILDLPDGQYNVQARLDDEQVQSGMITVDSRAQKFGYVFAEEVPVSQAN